LTAVLLDTHAWAWTIAEESRPPDWPHRDPFDRLLAATAIRSNLPIDSSDIAFDGVVTRLW
jgi:PIN domain nuclease of toxin-antitoxin system